MKNKISFILVVLTTLFIASNCSQNAKVQDQNKATTRETAANKAKDINGLMQADTDSTQTLSTANANSNVNSNADSNINTNTNR
jgi:PBP1b-binding outer membrane lipoprotein LpoB